MGLRKSQRYRLEKHGYFTLVTSPQNVDFTASNFATLYLVTTGASRITASLPTAVGFANQTMLFKKVDSGTGTVVLAPTGGQEIDVFSSFTLSAQGQVIGLVSDGSKWEIFTRN